MYGLDPEQVLVLAPPLKQLKGLASAAHLSLAVETQDLKADAGCSPRLDLMKMSEEVEPCPASPVVQLSLCQDPQQSGLA